MVRCVAGMKLKLQDELFAAIRAEDLDRIEKILQEDQPGPLPLYYHELVEAPTAESRLRAASALTPLYYELRPEPPFVRPSVMPGATPLYFALAQGSKNAARLLLMKGA